MPLTTSMLCSAMVSSSSVGCPSVPSVPQIASCRPAPEAGPPVVPCDTAYSSRPTALRASLTPTRGACRLPLHKSDDRLWPHTVVLHRLRSPLTLQRCVPSLEAWDLDDQANAI